jgi:hypothetical protein
MAEPRVTGYHPFRAFSEHVRIEDPYLFDPQDDRRFLDYGYEVQASLVEEYVCCRAVDPRGARTARLERLIGQVMPVTPLQSRADAVTEVIPWEDADLAESAHDERTPHGDPGRDHVRRRDRHPASGGAERAARGQYRLPAAAATILFVVAFLAAGATMLVTGSLPRCAPCPVSRRTCSSRGSWWRSTC